MINLENSLFKSLKATLTWVLELEIHKNWWLISDFVWLSRSCVMQKYYTFFLLVIKFKYVKRDILKWKSWGCQKICSGRKCQLYLTNFVKRFCHKKLLYLKMFKVRSKGLSDTTGIQTKLQESLCEYVCLC